LGAKKLTLCKLIINDKKHDKGDAPDVQDEEKKIVNHIFHQKFHPKSYFKIDLMGL
jgi:hypothetical protein